MLFYCLRSPIAPVASYITQSMTEALHRTTWSYSMECSCYHSPLAPCCSSNTSDKIPPQSLCICCSFYWDTLSPDICMACFLNFSGLFSKATFSMRPSPITVFTLGLLQHSLSLSPDYCFSTADITSLHNTDLPHLLCFSLPLLECKLHPSLNLFVYFCIPRT